MFKHLMEGGDTVSNTPSIPSAPTLDYRVDGGFKVSWVAVSGATLYSIRLRRGYDGYTTYYDTTSTSYTFRNLLYGVIYHISVSAFNSIGGSPYSIENPATTAPKIPYAGANEVTKNSIRVYASVDSGNVSYINVAIYENSPRRYLQTVKYYGGSSYNFTGLKENTEYYFEVRSYFTINGVDLGSVDYYGNDSRYTFTARTLRGKPNNWSWYTAKVSGNAFNITYSEWNDFCNRINEFRNYKGLNNYPFTTVRKGDIFYASYFNQAVNAIWAMSPSISPPSTVSSGDTVTAYMFNRLRDSLNSVS